MKYSWKNEAYSKPLQTSDINSQWFSGANGFSKSSILVFWLGYQCASISKAIIKHKVNAPIVLRGNNDCPETCLGPCPTTKKEFFYENS